MLKEIDFDSVARYSRIGIETSPNETTPRQIDRAIGGAMLDPNGWSVYGGGRAAGCIHVARRSAGGRPMRRRMGPPGAAGARCPAYAHGGRDTTRVPAPSP